LLLALLSVGSVVSSVSPSVSFWADLKASCWRRVST
jgi:hypothetical protein